MPLVSSRSAFWFDCIVATLLASLSSWSIYAANEAAADAVRMYGYNVDSGALVYALGVFYFAPVAVIFGIAALSFSQDWRIKWYVHWLAVVCAIGPILFAVASLLVGA